MYEMFEFPDDSDNSDEFPYEMRPSTLEEREEFYRKEFDVEKAEKWLWRRGSFRDIRNNTVFAVIIGRHSDIYSPKFEPIRSKVVIIDEYESWNDIVDYILYYYLKEFIMIEMFTPALRSAGSARNAIKSAGIVPVTLDRS
jgi:DNA primase catalytic subunit